MGTTEDARGIILAAARNRELGVVGAEAVLVAGLAAVLAAAAVAVAASLSAFDLVRPIGARAVLSFHSSTTSLELKCRVNRLGD